MDEFMQMPQIPSHIRVHSKYIEYKWMFEYMYLVPVTPERLKGLTYDLYTNYLQVLTSKS